MSILTNFLKLVKPEKNDYVDVEEHISNNLDKIDEKMENFNLNKLDKGGYTGTAQNLLTEISKIASKTALGRMIVGKGLTVDSSGRTSVVSRNDGIIVNDNDIQLNVYDGVDSTSTTRAGSAKAVKMAYDKGVEGLNKAGTKLDAGSVSTEYNTAKKIEDKIKEKQDKTDNGLETDSKEIVGAINENIWYMRAKILGTPQSYNDLKKGGLYYSTGSQSGFTDLPKDYNHGLYTFVLTHTNNAGTQISFSDYTSKMWTRRTGNEWVEILTLDNKYFLGNAGLPSVRYIQDVGQKIINEVYIDKDTGKLYIANETNNDTSVTAKFRIATNAENAKNSKNFKGIGILNQAGQTLNVVNYSELVVYSYGAANTVTGTYHIFSSIQGLTFDDYGSSSTFETRFTYNNNIITLVDRGTSGDGYLRIFGR